MSSFRPWAFWRRVQYGAGFGLCCSLLLAGFYFGYLYAPANCFDGAQNGDETGIDCGGRCVRICAADVLQPTIVWAESFKIVDGQYNALAYVENQNAVAATPDLRYTFRFYDASGSLITERQGSTILPPNSVYPIFEGRITTDGREVVETEIVLAPAELWQPAEVGREQFSTEAIELLGADLRPRLNATVENTALTEAANVEVVATIFDRQGAPLTASQTYVDRFAPRTKETVVFTWPEPIAKTLRSCEVPTDVAVAIDLSGSMNNDQASPPEPITSVLEAAGSFVGELRPRDQVAVVTFATDAALALPLTSDAASAASTIRALTIDPAEETGNTNTGAALRAALAELDSPRHNTDARSVVVLLTDGLATAPDDPEAYALDAAAAVKAAGIELYTIGLGQEVNMDFLRTVAEAPSQAYQAVTTTELGRIYDTITSAICEEGPARIDIIPKSDAAFTPLR